MDWEQTDLGALATSFDRQEASLSKQVRLERALRETIGEVWPVGRRLPPHRLICEQLGVARNTLAQAIKRLVAEGWLVTGQGQGTWANRPVRPPEPVNRAAVGLSRRAGQVLGKAGASPIQTGAFVPGVPDITHFPMRKWRQLYTSVTVPRNALLLSYSTGGYGPLKRAIRDLLWRLRGLRCDSEQIIITDGAHHGIELCALALADIGDRVLMDSPCYWGARNVFSAAGLSIEMLPWYADQGYADRDGQELVQLIYFTGALQYPLSAPTDVAAKRRLCQAVAPAYVVEDDYDFTGEDGGNLIFDPGQPNHILVGSFSKLLFPGLRMGYLVVPHAMAESLNRLRSEISREGRMLDQAVLAQFIDDGDLDAWYRRIRRDYLGRQQVLHDRLIGVPGVVRVSTPMGGIGLCAELTPEVNDVALAQRLLAEQLVVRPLSPTCAPSDPRKGLVLGIGMVSEHTLYREADRLRSLLKRLLPAAAGL